MKRKIDVLEREINFYAIMQNDAESIITVKKEVLGGMTFLDVKAFEHGYKRFGMLTYRPAIKNVRKASLTADFYDTYDIDEKPIASYDVTKWTVGEILELLPMYVF